MEWMLLAYRCLFESTSLQLTASHGCQSQARHPLPAQTKRTPSQAGRHRNQPIRATQKLLSGAVRLRCFLSNVRWS
ncbi:hypothetical protein IWX46DRAFT_130238 [Phyllosticta citricarpa]|uniref:Secreted protein n=1 Tax=Phyllosticta citricarpa TaxID=55181 RepID=A0ABR1MP60_9PEZI